MYGLSFHGDNSRVSGSIHADSVVDRGVEKETRCAGSVLQSNISAGLTLEKVPHKKV